MVKENKERARRGWNGGSKRRELPGDRRRCAGCLPIECAKIFAAGFSNDYSRGCLKLDTLEVSHSETQQW